MDYHEQNSFNRRSGDLLGRDIRGCSALAEIKIEELSGNTLELIKIGRRRDSRGNLLLLELLMKGKRHTATLRCR